MVTPVATSHKTIRLFLAELEEQGWSHEKTNSGHYRLTHSTGALAFMGSTPSDHRWVANTRATLKKALHAAQERTP